MRWSPRLRLVFARRPWLYWALAGALTTLAWWQVSSLHAEAQRARDAWGSTVPVWVAATDAAPGAPVTPERHDFPRAVVPRDAVTAAPEVAVAARRVVAGSVLVAADLVADRTLPTTWVVFAVPADGVPTLAQGDGVAVFAGGRRLCDGTVSAPPGAQVEFGVPPECAADVGNEVALGGIVVARRA